MNCSSIPFESSFELCLLRKQYLLHQSSWWWDGHSVTFFAIISLFEVTTDGRPKHDKSSNVCSFPNFFIEFNVAWLDEYTEFGNSYIKSSRTRFNELVSFYFFTINAHCSSDKTIFATCSILTTYWQSKSSKMWHTSVTWTSVAFDVFQKFRNTLVHLSENLKNSVKLLLKCCIIRLFSVPQCCYTSVILFFFTVLVVFSIDERVLGRIGRPVKCQPTRVSSRLKHVSDPA